MFDTKGLEEWREWLVTRPETIAEERAVSINAELASNEEGSQKGSFQVQRKVSHAPF